LAQGKQWVIDNKESLFTNQTVWCKENPNTHYARNHSTKLVEHAVARSMAWHFQIAHQEETQFKSFKTMEQINEENEHNRREQALKYLNVGDKLKYANSNYYANHKPTTSRTTLREWQGSGKHFLLFIGATDSSKTFAGIVGMTDWMQFKEYANKNGDGAWDGLMLTARQIGKITQSPLSAEYTDLYRSCTRIRFLMIDELLGKECTPSLKTFIEEIISEREKSSSLYTIMTSNCTMQELATTYDDRFMSRIQGDGIIAICPQENLRVTVTEKIK